MGTSTVYLPAGWNKPFFSKRMRIYWYRSLKAPTRVFHATEEHLEALRQRLAARKAALAA